jgi:hypothetical protein
MPPDRRSAPVTGPRQLSTTWIVVAMDRHDGLIATMHVAQR